MCRHAAYIGPGIAATELMSDLDHSLLHQAYQARELLTGVVCADGYGFGWLDDDREEAGRYGFPGPIWSDTNLETMGRSIHAPLLIGAVRNATVAGHNTTANAAPFQHGRLLWSLNGYLEDFDASWKPMVKELVGDETVQGSTDAEYLFAAWRRFLAEEVGEAAGIQAMQRLIRCLLDESRRNGKAAQLNILACDGHHLIVTRAGSTPTQNSLYTLHDGSEFPDAWVVASEPLYDDPLWEPVAPDSIIALSAEAPPVRLRA